MKSQPDPIVVQALVSSHRRFLAFLERRTGNRADAEDLLQAAFARTLERGGELRDGESAIAWFYRLLRNALTDRFRAQTARERALESKAQAQAISVLEGVEDDPLREAVCACVIELLPTMKREYADLIRRVDLDGEPVTRAADALGITPNNAGVRLHRARKALLREVQRACGTCATHGCLDCTCGGPDACSDAPV